MEKHKEELMKKSRMVPKDFNKLLQLILQKVVIVPSEILYPYRKEALEIIKEIDVDDVVFVACALVYPDSILWSDDKQLKKQSKITVLNTKQIKEFLT